MSKVTPSLLKTAKHFENAEEIICLDSGERLGLNENTTFRVIEDEIFSGETLVWSEGKFAKIVF